MLRQYSKFKDDRKQDKCNYEYIVGYVECF